MALPPDPDGRNDDRARFAKAALQKFHKQVGGDWADCLPDLLGDLMHWCDRNDRSFYKALRHARWHYTCETVNPNAEPPVEWEDGP